MTREPVGVCALVMPWNAPLPMVACKLGAALSTGNTCVVKPPSVDSLTTLKLAEILQGLNMPPGTVNIITGPGDTVGAALASHNDVDKVAFTGAVPPGMVAMAFHFAECPTNELISSATLDPVTRTPAYKTCPVRVRKIDKVTGR